MPKDGASLSGFYCLTVFDFSLFKFQLVLHFMVVVVIMVSAGHRFVHVSEQHTFLFRAVWLCVFMCFHSLNSTSFKPRQGNHSGPVRDHGLFWLKNSRQHNDKHSRIRFCKLNWLQSYVLLSPSLIFLVLGSFSTGSVVAQGCDEEQEVMDHMSSFKERLFTNRFIQLEYSKLTGNAVETFLKLI